VVSGVIRALNQDVINGAGTPTHNVSITAGGITVGLWLDGDSARFGNPYDPPEGMTYGVLQYIEMYDDGMPVDYSEWVYYAKPPASMEFGFSISVSASRIDRTRTHSPGEGRDASPVYAAETAVGDAWVERRPAQYNVSMGSVSASGEQTYREGYGGWQPHADHISVVGITFQQYEGLADTQYAEVELQWAGVDVDFSGRYKVSADGQVRLDGAGNTLKMGLVQNQFNPSGVSMQVAYGEPYIKDFSDFAVVDRDGNLVGDILINGGFVADKRYSWTADCPTI
jgi:hypothetical protein